MQTKGGYGNSNARKHGMANSSIYGVYRGIIQRCEDENCKLYPYYGGRGITICVRWRSSFANFLIDMGHPPNGYCIERIDNDKGYYPLNCRWATRKEQARNRRSNHFITVDGVTKSIAEWTEYLEFGKATIGQRIYKGWNDVEAVTTPMYPKRNGKR